MCDRAAGCGCHAMVQGRLICLATQPYSLAGPWGGPRPQRHSGLYRATIDASPIVRRLCSLMALSADGSETSIAVWCWPARTALLCGSTCLRAALPLQKSALMVGPAWACPALFECGALRGEAKQCLDWLLANSITRPCPDTLPPTSGHNYSHTYHDTA